MVPSFFRHIVITAPEAADHPDLIRRMRGDEIDGIVIGEVYDDQECARIVSRLEAGANGLVRSDFPARMRAYFLGINLNLAPPDLNAYFEHAPAFRAGLKQLFSGSVDLETRITGLLSCLDSGRPYHAAPGPRPQLDHMFTTLRAHMPGGFIPPHFDNEQAYRDSYRLIMPRISADLFSFVLAFSRPEVGGELEVFNMKHGGRKFRMVDGPDDAAHLDLTGVESVRFKLKPGEMILFNSGRYLHRVTPVSGAATRWTACSFMAESRTGDQVYCWG